MKRVVLSALIASALLFRAAAPASAQSISAGTIVGTVTDPSGGAVAGSKVSILNPVSNYQQSTPTDSAGTFRFTNVPMNSYHLTVTAPGFAPFSHDVTVRSNVPVTTPIQLELAGAQTSISVEASGNDMVENMPVAHNDVDQNMLAALPTQSPAAGLSAAITMSAPGVVADSNGFFPPSAITRRPAS